LAVIWNKYTTINAFFNEDLKTYYHEGVDFDGVWDKTPIHALIYGTVVMKKDQQDNHYGLSLLIQGNKQEDGKNMFYLLGHMSRYAAGIDAGCRVR
jgi:murein DD-endopeptidase MepM/ murein hydrolase activator NlpD